MTSVRRRDEGAVATIVAILFMFGVMLGLGALTVDVGNINADRRQLQNGADAVALAAAQQCASTGTCPAANDAGLQALANVNAADGATDIRRVDGQIPLLAPAGTAAICGQGTGLFQCRPAWTASVSNLQECPSTPTSGVNFVRVYTETKNAGGSNILPYSFGAAIAGVGSGANQQACASVSWGQPSSSEAPFTMSYCEWAVATGNNPVAPVPGAGTYAANPTAGAVPGYGLGQTAWPVPARQLPAPPVPGQEIIIALQDTTLQKASTTSTCHTWNTHDAPGGFGYLSTAVGCTSTAVVGGWIKADTGNTLPSGCTSLLPFFHKVIYVPVFDCTVKVTGSVPVPTSPPLPTDSCIGGAGNNTYYHIQGYAQFYLSGYKTAGNGVAHTPNENNARTNYPPSSVENPVKPEPCTGSDRCLSGWFLKGLVNTPPTPPTGSPGLGTYAIQLSG